jgi:hypothetical protein
VVVSKELEGLGAVFGIELWLLAVLGGFVLYYSKTTSHDSIALEISSQESNAGI